MDKNEILEKASKRKVAMGEMEAQKIGIINWIAMIVASVFAGGFCIASGVLGVPSAVYAILAIFSAWACVFYTLQYAIAKRPWPVLIGAVLTGLATAGLIVCFVLSHVYGW